MIILGVALLLVGIFAAIPLLITVGLVVGGIGLLLVVLSATGHQLGGRNWY